MAENNEDIFALLIGVDYYFPNKLYGSLSGAVRDVQNIATFLKSRLGVPEENIVRLTATDVKGESPAEDSEHWPTYENIIRGFERVMAMAQEGDQVIVHYSGHGGRAKTIYPADIKSSSYDEALVPTNIGSEEARYVRDLELAHLLDRMNEQGLVVTVVLDSCHSGGMTRGEAVPRGILEEDDSDRPTETLAAPDTEALLATWRKHTSGTRSATPITAGGLPASDDWVVLTACRPQELAYETNFDGNRSGVLTYWLLDSLKSAAMGQRSYKSLHQLVLSRVQSQFSLQRPQLYGDGDRPIFGHGRLQTPFTVPVLSVNSAMTEVELNAGVEQGVNEGAQFAIFPPQDTDLNFDQAIAQATVTTEGVTQSTASVDHLAEGASIEPGAQAVLYHPGSIQMQSSIYLQSGDEEGALPAEAQEAFHAAHTEAKAGGFLIWAEPGDPVDFIVASNEKGEYEIWDAAGEVIPRISPILLSEADAPSKVIERLIHLTRYRNVQQLANSDSRARGVPSVTFEWLDVPADHTFVDGDEAQLMVHNDSNFDVEITIFNLAPDWRIEQLYPPDAAASYTFAPDESDTISLDVFVSDKEKEETNIFKLFATVRGTDFRVLELPSLDEPMRQARAKRAVADELDSLLAQVVEDAPDTRDVRLRDSAVRQWTTAQVELRVQRP